MGYLEKDVERFIKSLNFKPVYMVKMSPKAELQFRKDWSKATPNQVVVFPSDLYSMVTSRA